MEAGKELDAIVSEAIFGVKIIVEDCVDDEGNIYSPFPDRELYPDYSTDMRAAWMVVEKLCNWDMDDNMLVLKGQSANEDSEGAWWEADMAGCAGHFVARTESAPYAICLAALKCVGYVDELFERSSEIAMRHDFSEDEIEEDIAHAIKEVRDSKRKRGKLRQV